MTVPRRLWSASAEYLEWVVAPVDESGDPIDPTSLTVEFAALAAATAVPATWAACITAAADSGSGEWSGPDDAGRYTARILASGTGGTGTLTLPAGEYRVLGRITDAPETPMEEVTTLVVI